MPMACSRVTAAVATENRIRAGADAAMGYPRFGMLDPLKLLSGLLVGALSVGCHYAFNDFLSTDGIKSFLDGFANRTLVCHSVVSTI
jgi:hypothetical protein